MFQVEGARPAMTYYHFPFLELLGTNVEKSFKPKPYFQQEGSEARSGSWVETMYRWHGVDGQTGGGREGG